MKKASNKVTVLFLSIAISSLYAEKSNQKYTQKYSYVNEYVSVSVKTTNKKLLRGKYQPIRFIFSNTGNEKYTLKAEDIGLRLLSKTELEDVAKKRYSLLPFTTIAHAQVHTFGHIIAQTLNAAHLAISLPMIITGTLIHTALDQYRIMKLNKREKKVFEELKKGIVIKPYSVRKLTLYVKKENIKPKFDIKLVSAATDKPLKFNVKLSGGPKLQPKWLPGKEIELDKK